MQDFHILKNLPEKRQVHRWIHQPCHDVWSAIRMRWAGRISRTVFNRKKKLSRIGSCSNLRNWKIYDLKGIYYLQNPKLCNVNFGRKTKKTTILQLDLLGYGVILPLLVKVLADDLFYKELWGPIKWPKTTSVTRVITLLLGVITPIYKW